jgi:hypothetical protein
MRAKVAGRDARIGVIVLALFRLAALGNAISSDSSGFRRSSAVVGRIAVGKVLALFPILLLLFRTVAVRVLKNVI